MGFIPPTLRSTLRRIATTLLLSAAFTAAAAPASAQNGAAANGEEPAPKVVRVALTPRAAERLSEARLRRLVHLQLAGAASVANEPIGPLDENAVRVFIDLPDPATVVIQVQAPRRRLAVRRVDVAGLPWDASTRFVAIAATEAVSVQLRPLPPKKTKPPTPEEIAAKLGATPAFELGGALVGAWLQEPSIGLFGARVRAAFHGAYPGPELDLVALGTTENGAWLEAKLAGAQHVYFTPDIRGRFAVGLGLAAAFDPGGEMLDDEPEPRIRAYGGVGLGFRLAGPSWIAFEIEPGVAIDAPRERATAWVGGAAQISFDALL